MFAVMMKAFVCSDIFILKVIPSQLSPATPQAAHFSPLMCFFLEIYVTILHENVQKNIFLLIFSVCRDIPA